MRSVRIFALLGFVLACALLSQAAAPPTPSEFLKFQVGGDRQLADYHQIVSYFKALAAASPQIEVEKLGPTTLGNDMIMAIVSSEENLKNKKKYQEIAHKLADPRGLTPEQVNALIKQGRLIVLVTANIHSTEIGASQMLMEWAHALVTAQDAETKRRLNEVILLIVPSLNPDGQIMETEWYRKNLGTKFEGSRMPWLYHHYVGHDNNRDWYMLTQKETQAVNRAVYSEWFPQIWLDEHQMGSDGPRIFMPPYTEPISSNIDPLMWRGVNLVGSNMSWRLEQQGKSGVIYGFSFDGYWPGATESTAQWKNIFGLLTEVASVRLATPIDVSPTELSGGRKGLIEYKVQANYPNPWPGGRWRLRDIMDYERIASDALLESGANGREDFLRAAVTMAQHAIATGKRDEYYQIRGDQRDAVTAAKLAHLMRQHGVEVRVVSIDGRNDFYIPTAHPYNRFVSEMLSINRYPKIKLTQGANIVPPYDVTSWSLPLMMGVEVKKVSLSPEERKRLRAATDADWPQGGVDAGPAQAYAVLRQGNNATQLANGVLRKKGNISVARDSFEVDHVSYPPGTLVLEPRSDLKELAKQYRIKIHALPQKPQVALAKLRDARVGLYKPWRASMDEGWTRWLLEQYDFNLKSLDNKTIKEGKLNANFDVILFPNMDKDSIIDGRSKPRDERAMKYFEDLPPEYAGGIGKEGVTNLKEFAENGGTIITLANSGDLLAEEFNIPVGNVLAGAKPDDFSCPGCIVRVMLDSNHPVNYGMPAETPAFFDGSVAYRTMMPVVGVERSVLASYPNDSEDILLSGWMKGAERLERRAAAVSLSYGKGKLVLFGFRVQQRAQTEGTFKMLFNAIHWAGMSEPAAAASTAAAGGENH